ncbi:RHS repeat domain-containing protein [Parabacteroides pacaensis]|uniref:RHS repeat domain-containing protein n=1 Tax=Parabacteroides pacaensis TaxID=2086575 RepID=UPI000D0F1547|nr:RHS repeat-associated core domain-containing protein [Parabacteroides pacaensis]
MDNEAIAIYEESNTSGNKCHYLHKDHLGSIMAYSDESGKLEQELSYDAWGRRRNPDTWNYYDQIILANAWHPRGFTGHEHIDFFELVNANGRLYDPVVGRFISPDPKMQAPDYTQGLNKYSYCLNNPLSLTDPSGYSWFSRHWKALFTAIVGIAASILSMGVLSGAAAAATASVSATQLMGIAALSGAIGGLASGLTGSLLTGANFGQLAKACFTGAFWGGVGGFLTFGAGSGSFGERLFKHTFSNGWLEGVKGGNVKHGLMAGAASMLGGDVIHKYGGSQPLAVQAGMNAIVGGTVAELGGGKFANGAITGAFAMLFNHAMHDGEEGETKTVEPTKKKEVEEAKAKYTYLINKNSIVGTWALAPNYFASVVEYARCLDGTTTSGLRFFTNSMRGVAGLQVGLSFIQFSQINRSDYVNKSDLYVKAALDIAVTLTAAVIIGGPAGFLICTTYFIVDAAGGIDAMFHWFGHSATPILPNSRKE